MGDIPTIIPSAHPDSFWASKVGAGIKANSSVSNPDFLITKTSQGTTLTLKRKHKPENEFIKYGGEFDATLAYDIDEVIRVMPNVNYIDTNGNLAKANVGLWRCCYPIPAANYSLLLSKASATIQKRYKRVDGVNYFPIWPEPAAVATEDVPAGRYWERWPPTDLCGE